MSSDKAKLKDFIQDNCILNRESPNKYTLYKKNGALLNYVFDIKKLILNNEMMEEVAKEFAFLFKGREVQLAGIEMSGALMVPAITAYFYHKYNININAVIVRKKRKKAEQTSLIEGKLIDGVPIVLIDDTVNSFSSCKTAVAAILEEYPNARVEFGFFIVGMKNTSGAEALPSNFLAYSTIFHKDDFEPFKDTALAESAKAIMPKVLWRFQSSNPWLKYAVPKSEPLIYKNSIMFGTGSGVFFSLDQRNGQELWQFDTMCKNKKGIISSAAIYKDNIVVFGNYKGELFGINADTGVQEWRFKLCDWIGSSPLVVGDDIFIGVEYDSKGHKGGIICFNPTTGKKKWEIFLSELQHGSCIYSEEYNAILSGTNCGKMVAINKDSGEIINMIQTGGAVKYHGAAQGSICVFGSFDGGIYVWDFIENRVLLKVKTHDIVYSRPLIHNNKAYIGAADGDFFIIDIDKEMRVLKRFYCREKIHSSPTLVDDKFVYFGVSNGNLIKIDTETDEPVAVASFPERITNAVVPNEKNLFVSDYTDTIYCVERF